MGEFWPPRREMSAVDDTEAASFERGPPVPARSKLVSCQVTGNSQSHYESRRVKQYSSLTGRTRGRRNNSTNRVEVAFDQPIAVSSKVIACSITANSRCRPNSLPDKCASITARNPGPRKQPNKEPPPVPVRSKIMTCNITGNAMARYEAHSLKMSGSITGRRMMTNVPHANKRTNNVHEPDRGKIVACAITGNSHQGYASLPVNNVGSITNRNATQKKTMKSTTRAKTIEDETVHKDSKADLRGIVEAKKKTLETTERTSRARYTEKSIPKFTSDYKWRSM